MNISILSFTRKGAQLSLRLRDLLLSSGAGNDHENQVRCFTMKQFSEEGPGLEPFSQDLTLVVGSLFLKHDALVMIGAAGIAVRAIAPWLKDKKSDPAVICIDESGTFVIPLLSGHIGGANRLALKIAEEIQAVPVLTTATDVNQLLAVDEWAYTHGVWISDMKIAKKISASLVDRRTVGLITEYEINGPIPRYLKQFEHEEQAILALHQGDGCDAGMVISCREGRAPFPSTLQLIPRILYLGIGCRKGTTANSIENFVMELLGNHGISIHAIGGIASIDLKQDEAGLLEFADQHHWPIKFYSAEQLLTVEGDFAESAFVRSITGVDNVCERAAVLLSDHGRLISGKIARNGVTAALAERKWEIRFEN